MTRLLILSSIILLLCASSFAQPRSDPRTSPITERTAGMQKFPGYFPFYWDAKAGKLWLEIDRWNSDFLYVEFFPAGIAPNDIGLGRGQVGQEHVVRFE